MIEVVSKLFVGSRCRQGDGEWAVVHACKYPCHYNRIGRSFKGMKYSPSLLKTYPSYVSYRNGSNLYLNIIDAENPKYFPMLLFTSTLAFIKEFRKEKKVLVHCNQGRSRSPALILLYLAKVEKIINNESYLKAKGEFRENYYMGFSPGRGIDIFLTKNWKKISSEEY